MANESYWSISDAKVKEGENAAITVSRTGYLDSSHSITLTTNDGSAIGPDDYSVSNIKLQFVSGQSSYTVNFETVNDSIPEWEETYSVVLTEAGDTWPAIITDNRGVITIEDNDKSIYNVGADFSVNEGDQANITISRTGSSIHTHTIKYRTHNMSATDGTVINRDKDYHPILWESVTFLPGETSKVVNVKTIEDSVVESDEKFSFAISGSGDDFNKTGEIPGITAGLDKDGNINITIKNDDPSDSVFSIGDVQGYEGDTLNATITRTGNVTSANQVKISTTNGTAFASFDFSGIDSKDVYFSPGETSKTVSIKTIEDSIVEADESFTLELSIDTAWPNVSFADPTAKLTILNDDSATQTNIVQNYTYNIDNSTKYTVNIRGNVNIADTLNVINVHNKFIGTDAINVLRGSSSPDFGEDLIEGAGGDDDLMGLRQADFITGGAGNDFVHGNHGKDSVFGGLGNDTVRGGHGPDLMEGGAGSDWMWGGIGANEVKAGANDGVSDEIYVPVDAVQNSKYGNPGGANRDLIKEIDASDKLYLHGTGITDSMLTYANDVLDPNGSGNKGVGIYVNGTLEALVIDSGLNATQINNLSTGGWYT